MKVGISSEQRPYTFNGKLQENSWKGCALQCEDEWAALVKGNEVSCRQRGSL